MDRGDVVNRIYDIARTFFTVKMSAQDFKNGEPFKISLRQMFWEMFGTNPKFEPEVHSHYTDVKFRDPTDEENDDIQSGYLYIYIDPRFEDDKKKDIDRNCWTIDLSDLYMYYITNGLNETNRLNLSDPDREDAVNHVLHWAANYGNDCHVLLFDDLPESETPMKILIGDYYDWLIQKTGGIDCIKEFLDKFENKVIPVYGYVHEEGRGHEIRELDNGLFFNIDERNKEFYTHAWRNEFLYVFHFFTTWIYK